MWHQVEEAISTETQQHFKIKDKQSISPGSNVGNATDNNNHLINICYKITDGKRDFFVKINNKESLVKFQAEAYSLQKIKELSTVVCPKVITIGASLDKSFLVLEYVRFSKPLNMFWFELGQKLAKMHKTATHGQFGWPHDNFIGNTIQPNHWGSNWTTFFSEQRIAWQLQLLSEKSILLGNINHISKICHDALLHHSVKPCLVHGDLWLGNTGFTSDKVMLFDPACYYGDREVDLAMTELFGHFPNDFYKGYQEEYPLDDGYHKRKVVYNLYHVLNHANMFGGFYIEQAKAMLSKIISTANY